MPSSLIAISLIGILAGSSFAGSLLPAPADTIASTKSVYSGYELQTSARNRFFGHRQDNRKERFSTKRKDCTPNARTISCKGREGIFVEDDDHILREFPDRDSFVAMPVAAGAKVSIAVCNLENIELDFGAMAGLVPTLVTMVGAGAQVRIVIENSANVKIDDTFNFGILGATQLALINRLVQGPVALSANFEIDIRHSANVFMSDFDATAMLTNANLLDTVIDGFTLNEVGACLSGCMNVNVQDSANIIGKDDDIVVTLNTNSQLEDRTIRARCLNNAHISVSKRNVANIDHVEDVTLDESSLSRDTVQVGGDGNTMFTKIDVHLSDFATIHAMDDTNIMDDSELLDSVVDLDNGGMAVTSAIHIDAHNVATVKTEDLNVIDASNLVQDFVEVPNTSMGVIIKLHVDELALVRASSRVRIEDQSDLIQNLVRLNDVMSDTDVDIEGHSIANVMARNLEIRNAVAGQLSSLIDGFITFNDALDPGALDGFGFNIHVEDIANTMVEELVTLENGGRLIEDIVHGLVAIGLAIEDGENLIIKIQNGGNVLCPGGRRLRNTEAELEGDATLVDAIIRLNTVDTTGITSDELAIVLIFFANMQVIQNGGGALFDSPEDAIVAPNVNDLLAMLRLTERDTAMHTGCERPPRSKKKPDDKKDRKKKGKRRNNKRRNNKRRSNKRRNRKRRNNHKKGNGGK